MTQVTLTNRQRAGNGRVSDAEGDWSEMKMHDAGRRACRRRVWLLWLVMALAQLPAWADGAGTERGLFWEVKSDGNILYLFGSIHLATAALYPLPPQVEAAFQKADGLVLELNPLTLDVDHMQTVLQQRGSYAAGRTVRDALTPKTYAALQQYLQQRQVPLALVEHMKPGLLAMTLTTLELQRYGFAPQYGLDIHFAQEAAGHKSIVELESVDEQLDTMLDISDADLTLEQTLDELATLPEAMDTIVAAWGSGDAAALDRLLITDPLAASPELRPVYERLFFQRNARMETKLEAMLASGKCYFVVVGAGHLVGTEGLVARLQKRGYRVRQL